MRSDVVEDLLDELFEQQALVIGGVAAIHSLESDAVWALMRSFDELRSRSFQRIRDEAGHVDTEPHPAIEAFLSKLRRGERDGELGVRE